MLLEFRVQNHRSLREEQALSLEPSGTASGQKSEKKPLPVIAIYGANASGKSNVLAALDFMQAAVALSHRSWEPEEGVPRDPFAWADKSEPSLYEATIQVDGIRYQYGFVTDGDAFVEEWLYAWPKGRKQMWFTREGATFDFGDHLKGENRSVQQVTRNNALFLSAAAQLGHEQLQKIYSWFRRLMSLNIERHSRRRPFPLSSQFWTHNVLSRANSRQQLSFQGLEDDFDHLLDNLRQLLKAADVGITDIKRVVDPDTEDNSTRPRHRIFMKHQHSGGDAWLPLEQESGGTRTLFRYAGSILQALSVGGLVFVDELESSLHPLLAAHIVRQFNDPTTNPKGAQLIFTTHDTNLLGTTLGDPLLSRDQVWLTEKDPEGSTALYPLSDYKPRKSENLERGYLQGRYGAIPFLGDLNLFPEE